MILRTILVFLLWQFISIAFADLVFDNQIITRIVSSELKKFEFSFKFKNTGVSPVTIEDIQTSCGCTIAKSNKTTYLPNEAGEINGVFRMEGRNGIQNKSILLTTNSLSQRQIQLNLIITIEQPIRTSSNLLYWKRGEPFQEKSIEVTLLPKYELSEIIIDKNYFSLSQLEDNNYIKLTILPIGSNIPIRNSLELIAKHKNKKYTHIVYLIVK